MYVSDSVLDHKDRSTFMLNEYQIRNFKAFASPEAIPIRPITLIYGPNSSGKSSIIQSLLLLKQTLEEANPDRAIVVPIGHFIDLGKYVDLSHRHILDQPLAIKFLIDINSESSENLQKILGDSASLISQIGLCVTFNHNKKMPADIGLSSLELFIGEEAFPIVKYAALKYQEPNVFLALEEINREHSFWKTWWHYYQYSLLEVVRIKAKGILEQNISTVSDTIYSNSIYSEDDKLIEKLQGLKEKIQDQLAGSKNFDFPTSNPSNSGAIDIIEIEETDDLEVHQSESVLESKISELVAEIGYLDRLIRLIRKLHVYSLDLALQDLEKLNQNRCIYFDTLLSIASTAESLHSLEIQTLSALFLHHPQIIRSIGYLNSGVCRQYLIELNHHVILNETVFYEIKKLMESEIQDIQSILPDLVEVYETPVAQVIRGESLDQDIVRLYETPEPIKVLLEICISDLKRLMYEAVYIGPMRQLPKRRYTLDRKSAEHTGIPGEKLPDILHHNEKLVEQVNQQFEYFGLGYKLSVRIFLKETVDGEVIYTLYQANNNEEFRQKLESLGETYTDNGYTEIRLTDQFTDTDVSFVDVGFGISQVLPIITQSLLSQNCTLIIEQPEVHIHPRLQANLGSLLSACIKPPFGNQFIIETHSEHLMLRLQKLIRKGELDPNDISVIYIDRSSEGSQCLNLRLDKDGDFLDEWPGGFFEEDFEEMFG